MNFQRFGVSVRPDNPIQKKKSLVIPGQTMPLKNIVARLASGNTFGISQVAGEYDGEGDEFPLVELDPADPINSRAEILATSLEMRNNLNESIKKSKETSPAEGSEGTD